MTYAHERYDFSDKPAGYDRLARQLEALLAGERDGIANAANTAALLFGALPQVSWVGFYFARGSELVLGPFQGKPACVRIAVGRGVCGAAAARGATLVVADVTRFPGHIACDPASRSEVVVPLVAAQRLIGVLDLDSAQPQRFDEADARGLERLAAIYLASTSPA